jgi:hypothetical protein
MITAERLHELSHYDPDTGNFTWLVRTARNVHVGDIAGWLNGGGYRQIQIDGRVYPAHCLAWLYQTNEWPAEIDHINGDRADNRWCNFRLATHSQNMGNQKARSDTTSWFKGVYWDKRRSKWRAVISINGKRISLGSFDADKPYLAYAAYALAARKHFGDFARVWAADQMIMPKKKFEETVLRNLLAATQSQFERAA